MTEKESLTYLSEQQRKTSYLLTGMACALICIAAAGVATNTLPAKDITMFLTPVLLGFASGRLLRTMSRVYAAKASRTAPGDCGTEAVTAALEERDEARKALQDTLNYWYPRLGYTCANEVFYPVCGDRRAKPAPLLYVSQR